MQTIDKAILKEPCFIANTGDIILDGNITIEVIFSDGSREIREAHQCRVDGIVAYRVIDSIDMGERYCLWFQCRNSISKYFETYATLEDAQAEITEHTIAITKATATKCKRYEGMPTEEAKKARLAAENKGDK